MIPVDVFHRIIALLDQSGIPYMLAGSFASAYHGTPRATQDIDIVIAPTADRLRAFVGLLPATEYYVSLDAALEAERRRSMFNVVEFATGWKIDFIIRKSRPFSLQEFDRRRLVDLEILKVYLASAEDIVISKLEWAKLGESQRQLEDVAGILRMRGGELDGEYLEKWIQELRLEQSWEAARKLAAPNSLP